MDNNNNNNAAREAFYNTCDALNQQSKPQSLKEQWWFEAGFQAALASNQPVAVDEDAAKDVIERAEKLLTTIMNETDTGTIHACAMTLFDLMPASLTQAPCANKVFTRDELVEMMVDSLLKYWKAKPDTIDRDSLRYDMDCALACLIAAKAVSVRGE